MLCFLENKNSCFLLAWCYVKPLSDHVYVTPWDWQLISEWHASTKDGCLKCHCNWSSWVICLPMDLQEFWIERYSQNFSLIRVHSEVLNKYSDSLGQQQICAMRSCKLFLLQIRKESKKGGLVVLIKQRL